MTLETLNDLYLSELGDIYNAEKQLVRALPKIIARTGSTELRQVLKEHLGEAHDQTARLEWVFEAHGESPAGKRSRGMEGILAECEEMVSRDAAPAARDAAIIAALQRAKHYEMAVYVTVRIYAQQLGHDRTAAALQQTLKEEIAANHKLSRLAAKQIEVEAARAA